MAVVINEFEVVDMAPPAARTRDDDNAAPPAPPVIEPEELRRLLAEYAESQLRRFSH
ncbi:hypothetical protein CBA19CS11_29430 [Caballeronia novacaledonica]|uniref:hypothetical protein n=1 Tax=Caballeronia novacaledonica TaxID=1544861 RepID=UPI001EE1B30A|nr:hypothetical protein [Caballeronia novacaledonica]GJH13046.1 hypothetical protein CBA19CS11_29430 [Caballeronia novacaledonica]